MTLLAMTATGTGLALPLQDHDAPDGAPRSAARSPEAALSAALAALPAAAPVLVMLHGKGYCPETVDRDPHRLIFAPRSGHARSRFVSWPRRLGFALPGPYRPRGLCVALGWDASGHIWRAARQATRVAPDLARLIQMIRRIAPERRIDLIGHSLGARVILSALPLLPEGVVGRVVLLAGADFTDQARRAMDSPAGTTAEVFNITTRENDLFDYLFECALSPLASARALGHGLPGVANWLDIQLDNRATETALRALGLPLATPRARICHWSVYLRPGTFRLYRALIHDRERLTLPLLRSHLAAQPDPRWARLRKIAQNPQPLT